MIRKILTCCLLITVLVPLAWSQERAIRPVAGVVDSNIRQALVIGNSEYRHAGRLRNPVNDARAIGSTLQQLGFDVTLLTDADQRKMERAIRDFGDELRSHVRAWRAACAHTNKIMKIKFSNKNRYFFII